MAPEESSEGPRWSLRLIDGWQLRHDGVPATVAAREQRVLSALALRGERSRSQLAGMLWPDSDDVRAQGSLRAAVWHLQHLHDGVVDVNGTIRLTTTVRVDLHLLRTLAHQLATDRGPADDGDALGLLSYDDLLPGWNDEWVREERDVLHQLRQHALENLADRLLERHDVDRALMAAMKAVSIDPLRESAWRALIRVHISEGNHVEAVRVYRAFRQILTEELGITVSPQIIDLVRPLQAYASPSSRQSRVVLTDGRSARR